MSRASSPRGGSRPNIIFVQCDSMDGRIMGCMGHPAMGRATPNLDALAARGVLFRNAYSNNPICCPSRASMWSGQYTHHCEGWNNYKGLSQTHPTFRTALDSAGYVTQTFGKTDYLSGQHTIRARVTPWTRAAKIRRPGYRMNPPLVLDEEKARVHQGDWDKVDRSIHWLGEAARADGDVKSRGSRFGGLDRPFMLYLGVGAPHPGFTTSRLYLDRIDEAGVNIPPDDEQDHPVMQYMRTVKNWEHGFSEEMVRKVRRIYFAMIAEVDAMVGRLLEAMQELGLADSTYLIFTSDHGEMAMEHRQFYKMTLYDSSARVPLIVAGPGVRAGAVVDDLVSLVDIHPTLTDMAGLARPEKLDGHSLIPELTGGSSGRPDWVLSEFHGTSCNTGSFMLRRGRWKYIAYVGYEPQLFDLEDDPDEIRNLAGVRPEVAAEMDRLLRQIVDYEAIDASVKDYDRRSFRQWRAEQLAAGTYQQSMARVYSGWDDLSEDAVLPWTAADETAIRQWLEGGKGPPE